MPARLKASEVETARQAWQVDRIHNPRASPHLDVERVGGLARHRHARGYIAEFDRRTNRSNGCTGSKKRHPPDHPSETERRELEAQIREEKPAYPGSTAFADRAQQSFE